MALASYSSLYKGLVHGVVPSFPGVNRPYARPTSSTLKIQRQCTVFQAHVITAARRPQRCSTSMGGASRRMCRCQATGDSIETTKSGGKILTLPTILTLARVIAIPALVVSWFSQEWTACAALFIGASLTDFLDGYLARRLNASSAFGAFLDPVADKLMVATVLILNGLTPVPAGPLMGNTWLFPVLACVIIGREITMSALREWAAALGPEAHGAVAVSWIGKWKTAVQMISLSLLLVAKVPGLEAGTVGAVGAAGVVLLGVAAVLTQRHTMARGKYRGRGGGRGGGRRPAGSGSDSDSSDFEERQPRGQSATMGMLPPSDTESDSEDDGPPRGQNPNMGMLPPSDSETESSSGDEDGDKKDKKVEKKPKELKPLVPDAPKAKKEEVIDPAQLAVDMERLELVKRRREEQRLKRIADEGWDRFAPLSETNRPPLPADYVNNSK